MSQNAGVMPCDVRGKVIKNNMLRHGVFLAKYHAGPWQMQKEDPAEAPLKTKTSPMRALNDNFGMVG